MNGWWLIAGVAILFLLETLYIRWARQTQYVDRPNDRSSHTQPTALGGGFIFPFAFSLAAFLSGLTLVPILVLAMALLGLLDDRWRLRVSVRLPFQLILVAILVKCAVPDISIWWLIIVIILVTGWLNTFNFMDGINGITVCYGAVMIFSLLWSRLWPGGMHLSVENAPAVFTLCAIFVFAWFNFRKKARVFAGDVGSVGLAFVIAWLFLDSWQGANSMYLLAFPALYAVDSVFTIGIRLGKGENIFTAHRQHLYQLLANECGMDHRLVSVIYAAVQLGVNVPVWWVSDKLNTLETVGMLLGLYAVLGAAYLIIRFQVILNWEKRGKCEGVD